MRYAFFGNSGSGKSTLARMLGDRHGMTVVDLDEIYWLPDQPGSPKPFGQAVADLRARLAGLNEWIIEGCYETLIAQVLDLRPMLVFLDPGVKVCQAHCRSRPFESHKYASRSAQDRNLPMLLDWVADYYRRQGEMSLSAHKAMLAGYPGPAFRLGRPPEPVTIRAARPEEAEALTELGLRSKAMWGYPDSFMAACREEMTLDAATLSDPACEWQVAEAAGEIRGYYGLSPLPDSPQTLDLTALFVDPECSGRAIGWQLLDHAVRTAVHRGATEIRIESDPNAERFYRKWGAQQLGTVPSGSIAGRELPLLRLELNEYRLAPSTSSQLQR